MNSVFLNISIAIYNLLRTCKIKFIMIDYQNFQIVQQLVKGKCLELIPIKNQFYRKNIKIKVPPY